MKRENMGARYLVNLLVISILTGLLITLVQQRVFNRYQTGVLVQISYNIILAVSLNLAAGYLGQLPLGHAGFMSVGAYTAAMITKNLDLPVGVKFPLALLAAGAMAAIFGIIIGLPALRLKGDYLAIITLGFGEIIRSLIQNLKFTGGAQGLRGIPKITNFYWAWGAMLICVFLMHTFMKSRHGRAVLAIRENEIAAEATGIPTTFYKVFTFSLSAFFAGIGGALYAHNLSILDPANFGFLKSVDYLVMVVLGGMGSMIGSIVAATGLTILPEALRFLENYRMVIYALVLILVMIFKPSGLFGRYDFSLTDLLGFKKVKLGKKETKQGGKAK